MKVSLQLAIFVLSCWLIVPAGHAAQLSPFTSDGCSAFPDGTEEDNDKWLQCCVAHDYAYWKGGTEDERLEADKELRDCVVDVGEPETAELMLSGVRVGGSPYWPTKFRWGYGWPFFRRYRPLNESELMQVRARSGDYGNDKPE